MKLTIILIVVLATVIFFTSSKKENPYFINFKIHHTKFGFKNPYLKSEVQKKKLGDIFKMMITDRPKPRYQVSKKINIDELDKNILSGKNFITWIGHSTMLLHLDGKVILTDPIFSDRCSPVQFAGPKRYTSPSIDIKSLPRIDIVLISHNHYDHLDKNTIKALKNDSSTFWYVPLGLEQWFKALGVENVFELDWFDERNFEDVNIVCLPSQHWSKRSLFKSFDTLWSSWSVKIGDYKFWFAGDTGYNEIQFKEIGDNYGPFDLSAIPIGGYEPRWFMKDFHVQPDESILIHKDIKSRKSIGMHFGTFLLTTEPIDNPSKRIKEILTREIEIRDEFIIPEHGRIYDL